MAGFVFLDNDNLVKIEVDWSGPDGFGGTTSQSNQLFLVDSGANISTVSKGGVRPAPTQPTGGARVTTAGGASGALLRGPVDVSFYAVDSTGSSNLVQTSVPVVNASMDLLGTDTLQSGKVRLDLDYRSGSSGVVLEQ
jgi:hypothetical protein